jgi:hypothetical protein
LDFYEKNAVSIECCEEILAIFKLKIAIFRRKFYMATLIREIE